MPFDNGVFFCWHMGGFGNKINVIQNPSITGTDDSNVKVSCYAPQLLHRFIVLVFLILSSFRPTTIALKKISVRGKVKIFFSTDVWFMVLKRSIFEIQKQRTTNFKDPSYGY